MASKRVITICQSGGEFVRSKEGTLTYNGGEAYAIDIDQETQLSDFKKEVAEMFNCNVERMNIKYFLPGNKSTLITISKDKDLQRMVSFVGEGTTSVDVFINSEELPRARNVLNTPASRSSRTTVSEALTPINVADAVMDNDGEGDIDDDDDDHDEYPIDPDSNNQNLHSSPSCSGNNLRKAAQQWENAISGVDQRFSSYEEFREVLQRYAIAHGFSYKCKKNDSHRMTAKCKSEGCKWRIYVSRVVNTQLVFIKKMVDEHTCGRTSLKVGCRASRGLLGTIIKEKLHASRNYKPKDIVEDINREFGIQLNYSQAWRAKEIAKEEVLGSHKDSYCQLPLFCEKLKESNPGSVATLITKDDTSFHGLFISFHASIRGFQHGCRPLVFLDTVSLNSKYHGELIAAISVDGNDEAFPIAFAIVDAENIDNWRWFLDQLKTALSVSQPVTFIADFQNGLNEVLREVFSNAYHGYCLRYIVEKLNNDLKGKLSHEARRLLVNDLLAAAHASKLEDLQHCIDNIKAISPEAYNWVMNSEPKQWANALFEGARYNLLMSNFGQMFFNWVSDVDELPIVQIVNVLHVKLMELVNTRRMEPNRWRSRLTPQKEEKLKNELLKAQSLQILRSNGCMFEVHGGSPCTVDIDNWICSCREWQVMGLPCSHAVAAFQYMGRNPYDYCSKYFTVDSYCLTYAESLQPIPELDKLVEGTEAQTTVIVTPPTTKRTAGRPKMKSAEVTDIVKRTLQCSKCKGLGHNKKTCKSS